MIGAVLGENLPVVIKVSIVIGYPRGNFTRSGTQGSALSGSGGFYGFLIAWRLAGRQFGFFSQEGCRKSRIPSTISDKLE